VIHLVGGSPSSGSTLLADLLDSTSFTASGPELEFFCNRSVYSFEEYKKDPLKTSPLHALRSTDINFRWEFLDQYGVSEKQWKKWVTESDSLQVLSNQFTTHFLAFRDKESTGLVFEKTPQNINAIDLFLSTFEKGYFIHIVRNPLNVYASLRKRKWGSLTSWATWLIYESKVHRFRNHPRFITIRYEDLIANPFEIVSSIINKISGSPKVSAEELQNGFVNNSYRQEVQSISTWQNQDRSTINPTQRKVDIGFARELSSQLHLKVSNEYAELFDLDQITLEELLVSYNYNDELELLEQLYNKKQLVPSKDRSDYQKIGMKWVRGFSKSNYKLSDLSTLMNPVG